MSKCKKPKKKYVPKRVDNNAWSRVLRRMTLLTDEENRSALDVLMAKNHAAMKMLTMGQGTKEDIDQLVECINTSIALYEIRPGLGKEFAAEIDEACTALYNTGCRGISRDYKFVFTAKEMECLNYFFQIYDTQLSAATCGELELAAEIVNEKIRSGGLRKFKPISEVTT